VIERYLEIIVMDKKSDVGQFHNELGLHYIAMLFKLKDKKDGEKNVSGGESNPKELELCLEKFNNLLRNPNAKYDPDVLRQDLKGNWLFKEDIYLLGKLKNHNEALNKLLEAKRFEEAELYCTEKNEQLLTKLFLLYRNMYLSLLEQQKKRPQK